jgi:hypothetical protein
VRLKEQRLWDTFRKHGGRILRLERVENVMLNGMPDVYAKASGKWIELKAPIAPKKESTRVMGAEGLSNDQKNWHLVAHQCGRKTYILIRDSNNSLYLIPGEFSDLMNDWNAEELRLHSVARTWEEILKELS